MKSTDINLNQASEVENTPLLVSKPEAQSDTEVPSRYPHFHYEGEDELPIPKRGKMTVEYEIVWEQNTETPDEETYACKVELRRIVGVEKEKDESPAKRDTSTEDALDRLMEEREEGENS